MSPAWKWFFTGYVWALPLTIIGLLLSLFYRAHSWRWSDGCLEAIGGTRPDGSSRIFGEPNAQTWGWLIFYDSEVMRDYDPIRVHERVHVVQAFIGGVLFGIAYVACWAWLRLNGRSFWKAYRENPFEEQAYARMSWRGGWGAQ